MRAKALLALALLPVAGPVDAVGIVGLPPGLLVQAAEGWSVYRNNRFGFSVEYPDALFVAEPPPANDDGRLFRTLDQGASLRVSGRFNALQRSLAEIRDEEIDSRKNATITYNQSSGTGFVLSGYEGGNVFYVRVLLSAGGEVINTLELIYPREWKARFDPVTARISRSFRAGRPAY